MSCPYPNLLVHNAANVRDLLMVFEVEPILDICRAMTVAHPKTKSIV
jgi:hypothetical protein